MNHIIECHNVWKRYGRSPRGIKELLVGKKRSVETKYSRDWVLQNISFNVKQGSSFAIIGHNGTGKSTLLSLLLGTIIPNRGSIQCKGRVASLLELGAGFHQELTGKENIYLYGSILGMTLAEIKQNFNKIKNFSELDSAIYNPIRTYSNGMITRLGFSIIIHAPADILLIDEVLAVGDTNFQQKCYEYLYDFKKRNGTLVVVSHDMDALRKICDAGMCIDMGKIVHVGSIDSAITHHSRLMKC